MRLLLLCIIFVCSVVIRVLKSGTGGYGRSTISDGDWLYIWVTAVYLGHGCVAQSHWLRHATFVQIAVEFAILSP